MLFESMSHTHAHHVRLAVFIAVVMVALERSAIYGDGGWPEKNIWRFKWRTRFVIKMEEKTTLRNLCCYAHDVVTYRFYWWWIFSYTILLLAFIPLDGVQLLPPHHPLLLLLSRTYNSRILLQLLQHILIFNHHSSNVSQPCPANRFPKCQ